MTSTDGTVRAVAAQAHLIPGTPGDDVHYGIDTDTAANAFIQPLTGIHGILGSVLRHGPGSYAERSAGRQVSGVRSHRLADLGPAPTVGRCGR